MEPGNDQDLKTEEKNIVICLITVIGAEYYRSFFIFIKSQAFMKHLSLFVYLLIVCDPR